MNLLRGRAAPAASPRPWARRTCTICWRRGCGANRGDCRRGRRRPKPAPLYGPPASRRHVWAAQPMQEKPPTHGWRSRGYLPHCDERGLVQHVVFGLDDAMPREAPPHIITPRARANWADKVLDAGRGSRLLAASRVAQIVQNCLLFGDGKRYRLAAWCVMPTRVHVLVEQVLGSLACRNSADLEVVHGARDQQDRGARRSIVAARIFRPLYAICRSVRLDAWLYREQPGGRGFMYAPRGVALLFCTLARSRKGCRRGRRRSIAGAALWTGGDKR